MEIVPSHLLESLAAVPQLAEQRAAAAAAEPRRRPLRKPNAIAPVANVDAVAPIGERGDDARRRDKHAEPPDDPRDHVDFVA